MTIELIPLEGIPEVEPGDDLAALLEPALVPHRPRETDVVAITQKIVSKAENRIVPGEDRATWVERSPSPSSPAGVTSLSRARGTASCARTRAWTPRTSREGSSRCSPRTPDASAERVQKELAARFGLVRLGVVITDTFGRPWREGVVDVAIGCAGLPAMLDLRGRRTITERCWRPRWWHSPTPWRRPAGW